MVNISSLKIHSPDHFSSVSLGRNIMIHENVFAKKNQGFGQQMADLTVTAIPILSVNDADFTDVYSEKKAGRSK